MDNLKEKFDLKETKKHKKHYSEDKLFDKFATIAKKVGAKAIYPAMLLYLVLIKPTTPIHIKTLIIGSLGYLISPIDIVPDAIIGAGLVDDISALGVAITQVQTYINDDIKKDAKMMIKRWIPEIKTEDLEQMDVLLGIN